MIRLIVDEPKSGSRNMSVDQALLKSAAEIGVATLRIYRWQPATVSLGYFQNCESRLAHATSSNCPLVRRASGGGAIIHDQEMTYSLALPADHDWTSRNRDLFDSVHRSLIECLAILGVSGCSVFRESKKESRAAPFLCFQRRAVGDVVLHGYKIIGSAQRRLASALLQHGSVLVGQSQYAPELPGICELEPTSACTVESLIDVWPQHLAGKMKWTLESAELTNFERTAAESIESEQFNNDAWTMKR